MKVTGGCHCGQITYEAEVDPATIRVCHCTDCQKLTGTAFRATIASLPGTFVLKSGTPKIYIKTAESGNKRGGGGLGSTDRKLTVLSAVFSACPHPSLPRLRGRVREGRGLRPRPHYSIGRPGWTLRESSGVNPLASAGIATSAISSGVQPP